MADNPKKYETVKWGSNPGKVPRWMLSALHAADKIVAAKWGKQGPSGETELQHASTAYNILKEKIGLLSWENSFYPLEEALDKSYIFDKSYTGGKASVLALLSDALWIDEGTIKDILVQQWAIWDKGKKPSDPSKALLEIHGLVKKGGGVSTPFPVIPPTPGPKPAPEIPPNEGEESGFPWWILAVAGVGAAWFFLTDREKKKRRVIGSRI